MSANWFLGRSAWRKRWLGLVGLGLLAGLVGGVVMASIGGIRRSSSALDRLIVASNVPPLEVGSQSLADLPAGYADALRSLPDVARVTEARRFIGREKEEKNWWSVRTFADGNPSTPVLVSGRRPDERRLGEVIVSVNTARLFGLDVGRSFTLDIYTRRQMLTINRDTWTPPRGPHPRLEVVGIYRDPLDAARSSTGASIIGTPALLTTHGDSSGLPSLMVTPTGGADLERLRADIATVNERFRLDDGQSGPQADEWLEVARVAQQQSQGVIAVGLGAFAAVALAAGAVAHGQSLRRWLFQLEGDQRAHAAMGATRADRRMALVIATAPHVVLAVPVAVAVATVLSSLFPFGVLRDVEPSPGPWVDGRLLAVGALAVVGAVMAVSGLVSDAVVAGRRRRQRSTAPLAGVSAAELAGAPVSTTVGVRFALRPGTARLALPVTTAMAAAVFAVAGVVAAGVFTASLDRLVAEPSRYGNTWDLNLELMSSPEGPAALERLLDDPAIEAVGLPATLNPVTTVAGIPVTATVLDTEKGPLMLHLVDGRAPSGPQEIVVGPRLLAEAGRSIGDGVDVTGPRGTTATLTIVGTALSPLSESRSFNREVFYSSEVTDLVLPADMANESFVMTQVRFAVGTDEQAAAERIDHDYPYALMNESYPAPPSEVANLAQLTVLPRALAAFLSVVGVAALVHALVVSVRSRRRDVGILRTLGFTRAQTASLIVSMTTTIVAIGIVIGIPLGLVTGAAGWRLVAERVYIDPESSIPWLVVAGAGAVAVLVANLIAVLPARAATRQAPIGALRAE